MLYIMTSTVKCSLCCKGLTSLYRHQCNNLICYECIIKNIINYLRLECPYCTIDYTESQLTHIFAKDVDLFDKINEGNINKMMTACNSGKDMLDACAKQDDMRSRMGEICNKMICFTKTIGAIICNLPFKFVLAMQKDRNNILIIQNDDVELFSRTIKNYPFLECFGVDRIIAVNKNLSDEIYICVYDIYEFENMSNPDHQDENGVLTMIPVSLYLNKYISNNKRLVDKLDNQEVLDITMTLNNAEYAVHIVKSLGKIISLPAHDVISASIRDKPREGDDLNYADLQHGIGLAIQYRKEKIAFNRKLREKAMYVYDPLTGGRKRIMPGDGVTMENSMFMADLMDSNKYRSRVRRDNRETKDMSKYEIESDKAYIIQCNAIAEAKHKNNRESNKQRRANLKRYRKSRKVNNARITNKA